MKLFEFEAKEMLRRRGVEVPPGVVVGAGDDVEALVRGAGLEPPLAVKSQVLVAGRGLAGGVRIVGSVEEAVRAARELLETPVKGLRPRFVLVEKAIPHDEELYAAVTIDRGEGRPVVLASRHGGSRVEESAREEPGSVEKVYVDPFLGLRGYQARALGKRIGLTGRALVSFSTFLQALYDVFVEYDAELVEVNPFTVVDGRVIPLDARVIVDDNALYRHPELRASRLEETGEYTELEVEARRLGLAFVELDGEVGIIGNGAGLTMATMDLVYEYGGRPANFLDIGGGASAERVRTAVSFLSGIPRVRSILINVFGGITRCDEVARGIVEAVQGLRGAVKPLVVRLTGTNEDEGRRILREHGIEAYTDLEEAVRRAVSLAA
ncbi:ADP-forming succinate--CoA ligase subunit beta [Stetteria hydrogenophila]